jgi:hypothetical protein
MNTFSQRAKAHFLEKHYTSTAGAIQERYKVERYKVGRYSTCSQSFFLPIMPGKGALALLQLLLCALLLLAPPAPLLLLWALLALLLLLDRLSLLLLLVGVCARLGTTANGHMRSSLPLTCSVVINIHIHNACITHT